MYEVTLEDYIRLASDIYFPKVKFFYPEIRFTDQKNTPDNDGFYPDSILKKKHGWTRLIESKPDPTGFFAAFYVRTDRRQSVGVIAYRGSDDVYDFLHHDLKLSYDEWPKVYQAAEDFYKLIKSEYKDYQISFTGHSLGGALAQLVCLEVNERDYFHAEKLKAICFNAPQIGYLKLYVKNKDFKQDSKIDHAVNDLRTNISQQKWLQDLSDVASQVYDAVNLIKTDISARIAAASVHYGYEMLRGALYLLPDFKHFGDQVKNNVGEIYRRFAYVKTMEDSVTYGQPAFNAFYHLVTEKPDLSVFNYKSFSQHYSDLVKSGYYDYIYNFNSWYDAVHVCGMPIGNQIEIDIDHAKYHEIRKFSLYDKRLREQAELRTFLTLQPEYFSARPQHFSFNHLIHSTNMVSNGSLILTAENRRCNFDLQRDVLSHLNVNYDGYTSLVGKLINYLLGNRWMDEAAYYVYTQHSMDNLAAALLTEESLIAMTFNSSRDAYTKLSNFRATNPLPVFDNNFHSKIKDLIIDAGLVNPALCVERA